MTSTGPALGLSQRLGDLVSGAAVHLQGCRAECASTARAGGPPWARWATMGKVAVPAGFGQTLSQQQPRATPLAMLCWAQATAAKEGW